jgi:hypothetical protein
MKMTNFIGIPFDNYNQKRVITDELHRIGQGYSVMDNIIYYIENFQDYEDSVGKMCWIARQNN